MLLDKLSRSQDWRKIMIKKLRQLYWFKRDRGKGGNFILLILLVIFSVASIVFFGARTAITSYHNYEEQKAESDDTEEANTASGSAVSSEAVTTGEVTEESNESQTEEAQPSNVDYEVDTSGMATFLGYMSDQAYDTLIKLTEDKCKEIGVNTAKKLDFQKVGATEFDVIGYIRIGNDKVCECAYNLKSDTVSITDTTYTESDIRDMEAARRKAETDELKKEQEEAKEAAEKKTEEDATKKKGNVIKKKTKKNKKN